VSPPKTLSSSNLKFQNTHSPNPFLVTAKNLNAHEREEGKKKEKDQKKTTKKKNKKGEVGL